MNHFSRKNLRFLAHLNLVLLILCCPNNGTIVVSFLLIHHASFLNLKVSNQLQSVMCLLQTPSLCGRRCLGFLVRFVQSAWRGHVKGEGDLLFSPLARAREENFSFHPINYSEVSQGAQLRRPYFFPACLIHLTQPWSQSWSKRS